MINFRKCLVTATIILGEILLLGRVTGATAAENEIKIGWQPAGFFELFLAREDKLFEKAGLKPTFVKFLSGPAMFAALKSGEIDVTFGGTPPLVYALAQNLNVSVFFWSFITNPSLVVRSDSGIKSVKDLANRKIATVMGSSAHFNLMELLADNKVPVSQVEILNMQVSSLIPAFSKGDIPAALIWEPWGVKLTHIGGTRIGSYGRYDKYSQTGIYWGRREWMTTHPEIMKKFLGVLDEALLVVRKDPSRAAKALGNQTGLDQSEVLEILNLGLQTYAKDMREPLEGHPLSLKPAGGQKHSGHLESLYKMGEFLHKNGNIPVLLTREQLSAAHSTQFLESYIKNSSR
ncbi:MAG: NrtA/SsuA/CpmA family ABC transporter substrate-binding protein [Planctomycetota bacterium]|nr:NrtA/SsuA/CpmA family ABC transporter substrate-binding protein [Planctomycetota bacterium]